MVKCVQGELQIVIDEMHNAYTTSSIYDYMNADYADFAGMALARFRDVLCNQTLSREDLEAMLRHGLARHRARGGDTDWVQSVASYVAKTSNANMLA